MSVALNLNSHRAQETDVVIIGAGPVGLFQAFQLGLQEIACQIIDALPHAGGQCVELYGDKPIYDVPGIPVCSGRELAERLQQQIAPFKVPLHLGQQVMGLERADGDRWQLQTSADQVFLTRAIVIAAGVGAFMPRRVMVDGLSAFEGQQVHYFQTEPARLQSQHVVVMGGEDAALETALQLADSGLCPRVTLLHRHARFKAEPVLEAALQQALADGRITLAIGQPVSIETCAEGKRLLALQIATGDDTSDRLALDALLPRLGLSPKLGPIADWGLAMERKLLTVDPATQACSEPGIFAIGDICHYTGKRKLLLCGFHEATMAAFALSAWLRPEQRQLLQYTTTSPRLHELLGVTGSTIRK
jgi:thioredoxin reductase (NADPH)